MNFQSSYSSSSILQFKVPGTETLHTSDLGSLQLLHFTSSIHCLFTEWSKHGILECENMLSTTAQLSIWQLRALYKQFQSWYTLFVYLVLVVWSWLPFVFTSNFLLWCSLSKIPISKWQFVHFVKKIHGMLLFMMRNGDSQSTMTSMYNCNNVPIIFLFFIPFLNCIWLLSPVLSMLDTCRRLFELLSLSGALAERTWPEILNKRNMFRYWLYSSSDEIPCVESL